MLGSPIRDALARGASGPDHVHYPETGSSLLRPIEATHFWFSGRRDVVASLLGRSGMAEGATGLDVGCGTGFTVKWLAERGFDMYGIDAYEPHLAAAFPGRLTRGDIYELPESSELDFVLLLDVLEHIEDDAAFLAKALRLLRIGGVAVLTVPALRGLWSDVDQAAGHLRRYERRDLLATVERSGVSVEFQYAGYFFGSLLPVFWLSRLLKRRQGKGSIEGTVPSWINSLFKGLLAMERRLMRWGGLPFGSSLVVALRRAAIKEGHGDRR